MFDFLNSVIFAVLNTVNDGDFYNLGGALEEIYVAYRGGDYGYVALDRVLGDSDLSRAVVNFAAYLGGK